MAYGPCLLSAIVTHKKPRRGTYKCHYCKLNGYSYRMMLSSATQITVGSRVTSSLLALVTLVQRTTIGISGLIAPPPFKNFLGRL